MDERLCCELIRRYPKALVHVRSQYGRRRFGLVFGSGVSRDFQIPDWRGLLDRIANHADVQGHELLQRERESAITMGVGRGFRLR